MWMRSKEVHLRLSQELLKRIDEAAQASFQSRSSYIRQSITLRLNSQAVVDHQKADDQWQAMIDEAVDAATQGYG